VQLPTGFSYFRSKVLTLNPRKGSLKGHRLLIIGGYEFGSYDSKPVAYVGNRPCIETAWHGPNELECLTPESKKLGKERVSVSVGGQISFPSHGVAYRYILPTSASDLHLDGLLSKLPCLGAPSPIAQTDHDFSRPLRRRPRRSLSPFDV